MKKKLLCVITIAVMMLALVGCGKKPETTIDAFCKALKASDDATMNSLMVDAAETTEEEELTPGVKPTTSPTPKPESAHDGFISAQVLSLIIN